MSNKCLKFFKILLVITLGVLLMYAVSILINLNYSTVLVIYALVVIGFFKNAQLFKDRDQLIFYCGAFTIKLFLSIYDTATKSLPMSSADYQVYHMFANDLITEVNGSILGILSPEYGMDLYQKFNALTYVLLENSWDVSYLFTLVFSLVLSIYLYKVAFLITNSEKKSGMIVLLWMITPLEMIYSVTFLKECYIQMFFIISFYNMVLFFKEGNKGRAFLGVIFAAVCTLSHSGMVVIVAVYTILVMFYKHDQKKIQIDIKGIIALAIVSVVVMASPIGQQLTARFQNIESKEDLLASTSHTAGTTNYVHVTPQNNVDLIIQTPYRFLMLALSPLPWQVKSLGVIIAWVLDALLQYLIFAFYIFYIFKYKPKDDEEKLYKILVVSVLLVTYLMFGWGANNFGSAMRHRLKIYPMNLIFLYYYWNDFKSVFENRKGMEECCH